MKIKPEPKIPRGFALVATLSLMVILVIVGVGLLQLAAVTVRSEGHGKEMAEARANARLGLLLAIGKLQEMAGPDQRVTALAEIAGHTSNSKWTGVWSTTTTDGTGLPMVAGHENGGYLTDLRNSDPNLMNDSWKEELRLGWLVSGEGVSPDSVVGGDPGSVQLVGPASLGGGIDADDPRLVAAPYVEIDPSGKNAGGYAFWVGDESQKARIDLGSPYGTTAPDPASPQDGGIYRLAGAAGSDFSEVVAAGTTPYSTIHSLTGDERSRLVSLHTLSLGVSAPGSPAANFHDITTTSRGLLTDVVMGGLKKDLTAVIESTTAIPPLAGVPGSGMDLGRKILTPANYADTGPSFAQLRNWYKLKDQINGGMLNPSMDPVVTTTRPGITPKGYFDMTAPLPEITSPSQPIQPIMTNCRLSFDMSLDTTRAAGRAIRMHLYPRITLWNPYNVTLKGKRYFVACALPRLDRFNVAYPGSEIGGGAARRSLPIPETGGEWIPGKSYIAYWVGNVIYFELAPMDIGPGEALVFSPDITSSTGANLAGTAVQYDTGNVSANVLSANVPSGPNNFFVNTNRMVPDPVDLSSKPDYGFDDGGINQAHTGVPTMQLKQFDGSGNISESQLNSTAAKTIQLIHLGQYGNDIGLWWFSHNKAKLPVNGSEGFQDYNLNPNRFPPRLWFMGARLRWLDEMEEESSLSASNSSPAFYNNPIIGNFNVRSTIVHRDPFSYYKGWTRYSPGGYMIPFSAPRLNDPKMDSPFRGGKSYGSPFSAPAVFSAAKSFAMFDLPRKDTVPFSLANFQHAQLGVHSWQPTYVIGNSLAEPRADRDKTVNMEYFNLGADAWGDRLGSQYYPGKWGELLQGQRDETLIYDMSYMVNQQLWDRYFLSTMPYSGGAASWDTSDPLPNSRLRLVGGKPAPDDEALLLGGNSFDTAARFLVNEGAFNVNSTSVEAWRAMLSTLNNIDRPTADGTTMAATFSRLLFPMSDQSPDSTQSGGTWDGARKLSPAEIDALANSMVDIVKQRGPFLGLADFVNRRLAPAQAAAEKTPTVSEAIDKLTDPSLCGPLQAAIELAGINSPLQNTGDLTSSDSQGANSSDGAIVPDWNAFYPYKNFGAPGYLTQADVLQTIGQSLTTRGDTFIIRSYGDVRDASGKILAKAWCEAVVQRMPEYTVSSPIDQASSGTGNNPMEPALLGAGRNNGDNFSVSKNPALLPINRDFGRKFTIQGFRWLNPSEI